MKKLNIIKKETEINDIIQTGHRIYNKYYYIYNKENKDNKYYRFCICVSKKLGNAVVRNKNKRQIKDIIDKSNLSFKRENDYVIILRKDITSLTYDQKRDELLSILK
ncbi:MAG: ribonuclease P protein component [Bacilli bacterium]|nr:ribonuclease P protein component [Bacilli bacterium]